MKNLLYKECKLALHPTTFLFWLLSAMLLIPSYPYYVLFFYTCLGVFFICLSGRENKDIAYTMLLPVRKGDIVRARIATACGVELLQAVIAVPFALIRNFIFPMNNAAGMEANVALFGISLALMGVFNLVFFPRYYRDPDKVGMPFLLGSVTYFVLLAVFESFTFFVPFFRDMLDTKDPQFLGAKLAVFAAGALVFVICNLSACRISEKRFEKLDL